MSSGAEYHELSAYSLQGPLSCWWHKDIRQQQARPGFPHLHLPAAWPDPAGAQRCPPTNNVSTQSTSPLCPFSIHIHTITDLRHNPATFL